MTLFKASTFIREQGGVLASLKAVLKNNPAAAQLQEAIDLGSQTFVQLLAEGLQHEEPWALAILKAAGVLPDPGPVDPTVLQYMVSKPFLEGGNYSWLAPLTESDLAGGELMMYEHAVWLTSNNSDQISQIPSSLSNRKFIGNSEQFNPKYDAEGNLIEADYGPLWGCARAYNVQGMIENTTVIRSGDMHKGREGHAWYFNFHGSTMFRNCHAYQCGGQGWQGVRRDSESLLILADSFYNTQTLEWEDCSAINCGFIDEPDENSPRGSWPWSMFNPGHNLITRGFKIYSELDPFNWSGGVGRSHGGMFTGHGQTPRKTPLCHHIEPEVEVIDTDRELWRAWNCDKYILEGATAKNNNTQIPDLVIVADSLEVVIDRPKTAVTVAVKSAAKPYGQSIDTFVVPAGAKRIWTP